MIKTILKYGAAGGLALVLYLNITYETGIMYSTTWVAYLATLAIVLVPIAVYLALRELKRKHYNGRLPFLPALVGGVLVAVMGALIYSGFSYADSHFFNLRMNREMIAYYEQQMKAEGKSEVEISEKTEKIRAHYLSLKPYKNTLFWYARMGVVYAVAGWLLLNSKQLKNKLYAKKHTPDNPHEP